MFIAECFWTLASICRAALLELGDFNRMCRKLLLLIEVNCCHVGIM